MASSTTWRVESFTVLTESFTVQTKPFKKFLIMRGAGGGGGKMIQSKSKFSRQKWIWKASNRGSRKMYQTS